MILGIVLIVLAIAQVALSFPAARWQKRFEERNGTRGQLWTLSLRLRPAMILLSVFFVLVGVASIVSGD